jgi:hypothetical protein
MSCHTNDSITIGNVAIVLFELSLLKKKSDELFSKLMQYIIFALLRIVEDIHLQYLYNQVKSLLNDRDFQGQVLKIHIIKE